MSAAFAAEETRAAYAAALQPPLVAHFDRIAQSTEGVARLRELILSLAVQGKLVPQDPADEPASALLERIRTEKARLVKDGKIRKEKPLAAIAEEEKPFALPAGWEWARLGQVASRVQYGFTASADHAIESPKFLRITDIQNDQVAWESVPGVQAGNQDLSGYFLEGGDLLIARTGGTIGKTFLVSSAPVASVFASYLIRVSPLSGILPSYLKTFASSTFYWSQLLAKSMGTGQPNVNGTALAELVLPLPPLAEQSRIVARIEELMALCDALEAKGRLEAEQHARLVGTLFDAIAASESAHALAENWQRVAAHFDLLLDRPEAVDALEQTILQLAVRGLLVPQDPADEPASALLQKIRAEKDRLIATGQIKRDKPLPPVADDEKPFEVPEGWEWTRFGAVVDSSEAGWSPSCASTPRNGNNWAVLKVSAVSWGEFRSIENKELPADLQPRPEYEVKAGDFLLSRANTEELVARSVIATAPESRLMMSDKIIRLHISRDANREFLNLFNNTQYARGHYAANASGTSSSMKNVSRDVVLALPVPLPPLAEQSRIVARVAELRTLCADLRQRLAAARETQSRLAGALVESALA